MAAATDIRDNQQFSIEVSDLSKRFNREWIFKGLTYSFRSGNTYAVTGPNGSGKSTLLQILWGQMPPTAGTLSYYDGSKTIDPEVVHQHVTIATPYMDLIDEFTLFEQLQFHFRLRTVRNNMTIDEVIDLLYLNDSRHKAIGNFSSGMKQRVKLGLAFVTKADVVFLDEPSTNLDNQAFQWYLKMLAGLPGNIVTVIASNQPSEYPENALKLDILSLKPGYR